METLLLTTNTNGVYLWVLDNPQRGNVTSRYHGSKIFGLTETAICIVPMEESRYGLLFCSWVQSRIGKLYMWWFSPRFTDCGSGHPLVLLRLASSDRPKFLAFSNKKKKSNDAVKPLFTWNNSFNLKNEHSNNIEKNRNKNRNIFLQYIVHFVICKCLLLTSSWGTRASYSETSCVFFFFRFFFFSIQPTEETQYQETHSTLLINEKKKAEWPHQKRKMRGHWKTCLQYWGTLKSTNQNLSITFVKFHLNVIFTSLLFS